MCRVPAPVRRRPRGYRRWPIDAKEDPVTGRASLASGRDPTGAGRGGDPAPDAVGIDPEDTEVVPVALTGLVESARSAYHAMRANGCYPAVVAVGAVEDTVATLARISTHVEPYVGDCSDRGGKAIMRASDLLGQARAALSDARHHLALDDAAVPELTPTGVTALVG
jgi:hypothetical protein